MTLELIPAMKGYRVVVISWDPLRYYYQIACLTCEKPCYLLEPECPDPHYKKKDIITMPNDQFAQAAQALKVEIQMSLESILQRFYEQHSISPSRIRIDMLDISSIDRRRSHPVVEVEFTV